MKRSYIQVFLFLVALLSCTTFPACGVDDEIDNLLESDVWTEIDSLIFTSTSHAIFYTNVRAREGVNVSELGVVYSTSQNPNLSNNKKLLGNSVGRKLCELWDLQANTTYYVRIYAICDEDVVYGEEKSFTTKIATYENGYEYIDLGLSVKWAKYNVGATNEHELGDYFAWGEIVPKENYTWNNYKYCDGSYTSLTKYNNRSAYGEVDNLFTLELSDDAARANWGGSWRMPSIAEWTELHEQCTWEWINRNGVYGYNITSKSNGNTIFLHGAGNNGNSSLYAENGYYWSSSHYLDYPSNAYSICFDKKAVERTHFSRYCGLSVRPVCP